MYIMLSLTLLLIPTIMIIMGKVMKNHHPKEINPIFGYRTSSSMKNIDTWKFANQLAGQTWFKWGWITLIPTVICIVWLYEKNIATMGIVATAGVFLQIIPLCAVIVPVERALKREFDDEGKRRDTTKQKNDNE